MISHTEAEKGGDGSATKRPPVRTVCGEIAPMWEMENDDARRRAIIQRAARGATRALGYKRDIIDIEPTPPKAMMVIPVGIPQWRRIVFEVALSHGVTPAELLGAQRETRIVLARHEAMYRLKTETKLSLPGIGRKIGRDHSSVIHGVRRHIERMEAQNARPSK